MVSETPSRVTNRSDNGSKESSMAKDKTNDNAKIYISPRFKSAATMAGLTEMRGLHQLKRISISRSLFSFFNQTSLEPLMTRSSLSRPMSSAAVGCYRETPLLDSSPWSALQRRGVKVNAIQLRAGNVIERTGRTFRVIEAEHKQQGRGGASIQVELRDVDTGNKLNLRFGSEESVEKVFVEEKTFTCLYTEEDTAYLIEPNTFEQVEVPLDIFGKASVYLKEEMRVQLHLYDGRALSASIPKHVTCTVVETQLPMKGLTSAPRYKKALLDNGSTIQVPSYLEAGEKIVINTEDDSFVKRDNK